MELFDFARIFFALLAVIGMIGLAAVFARKMGLASGSLSLGRERRLALVETLPLDNKRRAAIIRCDGREHLVVLNPNNVTVIERGLAVQSQNETVAAADETSPEKIASAAPIRANSFAAALKKLRAFAPTAPSFKKTPPVEASETRNTMKASAP